MPLTLIAPSDVKTVTVTLPLRGDLTRKSGSGRSFLGYLGKRSPIPCLFPHCPLRHLANRPPMSAGAVERAKKEAE